MALYHYKAAGEDGHISEGLVEAADRERAAHQLQGLGKIPLAIKAVRGPGTDSHGGRRKAGHIRSSTVDYFTLELATLLGAGLPLGQALATLADTGEDPAMVERVNAINQAVHGGKSLSEALEESGPEFDRFYINMVRAGESGGALDLALQRLAEFRQRRRETRQEQMSALLYPAILLCLALVAVAVLLAFVVPQFTQMFADAGRELPLLTRIVAGTGAFFTQWWWALLAALALVALWLRQDWKSLSGRLRWDRLIVQLPFIGMVVWKQQAARFARTLATLLENGVPLVTGLGIAKEIVSNTHVAQALSHTAQRVREGAGLSRALAESQALPLLAVKLVDIGESSGKLEYMLIQVADIYDKDVKVALKRLFTLAEPVIIITIALLITVIILSVILVILESNELAF